MASLLRALTRDGWPNQSRASGWRAPQDWSQSAWSRPVSSVSHQVSTRIQESNGKKNKFCGQHNSGTFPGKHRPKESTTCNPWCPTDLHTQCQQFQCSEHAPAGVAAHDVASSFAPGASAFPPGRGPGRSKPSFKVPLTGINPGSLSCRSSTQYLDGKFSFNPFHIWNLWNINFKISMGYSTLQAQFLQPETYPRGTSRFFRATVRSRKIRNSMRLWDLVEARPTAMCKIKSASLKRWKGLPWSQ